MNRSAQTLTIIKGVLLGYLITVILILLYSILLTYTNISESTIPTCVFVISIVSVFIASSISAINIREKGMKNGGLIGLIYILIMYILSSISGEGFALNTYAISTIIFNILLGITGGIIGVNLAK